MPSAPTVSYGFAIRAAYPNCIGGFARVVSVIGQHGGDLGAVDVVATEAKTMTRATATGEVRCHIRCQPNDCVCTLAEVPVQRLHKIRRRFLGQFRGLFVNPR